MKYTTSSKSTSVIEASVTVEAEEIKAAKKTALELLKRDVKAPGFRKGKAPSEVVEKQIDDELLQSETVNQAVQAEVKKVIEKENLQLLDQPQVQVTAFVPYETLELTVEFQVLPHITLGDYTKIKKSPPEVSVDDKEVDKVIDDLLLRTAEKKEVQRQAKNGDEVRIDFNGVDANKKVVAGASGKDYPLKLGSDTFIPGFEKNLLGVRAGDSKEFDVTFPDDYSHKPLQGKIVTFTVEVSKVHEVVLAKPTDEWAQKAGPFKNLAELKADIQKQLTNQKSEEALQKFKDEVVGEVIQLSEIDVPDLLVDDQEKMLLDDFAKDLTYRGITMDEYLEQHSQSKEDFIKNELRPRAVKRVQSGLVLAEISKKENISVEPQELDEHLASLRQRFQDPKAQQELDTVEVQRDVASRLLTDKTLTKLVEIVTS